jgi:hypothetical protein
VVVAKTFVWAHLPKTGGDSVAAILSLFPEIIEFADPRDSPQKHARFQDRAGTVAGRQRVLGIRRLPSWMLSRAAHRSRRGVRPDFVPLPMESQEEMSTSGAADRSLSNFVEAGSVWPDRWIRVEYLVDDVLALLEEHVEVTKKKRKQIRAMAPKNAGSNYDRSVSAWFTDEMIDRMYEHNPLWQRAEQLAYGRTTT